MEWYIAMRMNSLKVHGKYVESHKQEEQNKWGTKDYIPYDSIYIQ